MEPELSIFRKKRSMLFRKDENTIVKLYDPSCLSAEIKEDIRVAEKLMGREVPCVISYDLTLTGGAYGIEYFLPGVRTLGQRISEESSRTGFWAEKFAVFLKELKKVSFEPGELEDISRQFRLWTDRGKDFFSAQEQRRILELFDKIPESRSFACGNIHCGNVLVRYRYSGQI